MTSQTEGSKNNGKAFKKCLYIVKTNNFDIKNIKIYMSFTAAY